MATHTHGVMKWIEGRIERVFENAYFRRYGDI